MFTVSSFLLAAAQRHMPDPIQSPYLKYQIPQAKLKVMPSERVTLIGNCQWRFPRWPPRRAGVQGEKRSKRESITNNNKLTSLVYKHTRSCVHACVEQVLVVVIIMKTSNCKALYSLCLLLSAATICAGRGGVPIIRIVEEETSRPIHAADAWMHANNNNNMTHEAVLAMEGCDCTCDCAHNNNNNNNNNNNECSCSCQCQDRAHEALAAAQLLREERARLERERRLHWERRELAHHSSMGDTDDDCPGAITGLGLWNARSGALMRHINDGEQVCTPRRRVNFEAMVASCANGDPVESVQFSGSFGGRIENEEKYFQFGDYLGAIFGRRLRPGSYFIRMVPFSEDNAGGDAGYEMTVSFSVVDCPEASRQLLAASEEDDPQDEEDDSDDDSDLDIVQYVYDFVTVGFPGSGGAILEQGFALHNETLMASEDQCDIVSQSKSDEVVAKQLDTTLDGLVNQDRGAKYSFKCPTAIFSCNTISRLEKHSPDAKLILGLRHPIMMLESLYNARVAQVHEHHLYQKIPTFDEAIVANTAWKDVSLVSTRFEIFLLQFGKTALSAEDMKILVDEEPTAGYHLAIRPNKFSIFLYSYEQLRDADPERSAAFRGELGLYLNLSSPLLYSNNNDPIEKKTAVVYAETINICGDQYTELRRSLLPQASHTAKWIRERFLASSDVVTANTEHFLTTLEKWSVDPCRLAEENLSSSW